MLITMFCFSNCSKQEVIIDESTLSNLSSIIHQLGYDTTGISYRGDTITVEGDIILYKSNLSNTTPRQASMFPRSYTAVRPIKYYIPPIITDEASIVSAMEAISSVERPPEFKVPPLASEYLSLGFTKVNTPAEADLIFVAFNEQSKTCGSADAPTVVPNLPIVAIAQLKIGKNIRLNLFHWNTLSSSQRKFLVAHELGHSLGLRHTNWRGSEPEYVYVGGLGVGAYSVPGTSNNSNNPDNNSVFNMNTCGNNWSGFTTADKKALWFVAGAVTSY